MEWDQIRDRSIRRQAEAIDAGQWIGQRASAGYAYVWNKATRSRTACPPSVRPFVVPHLEADRGWPVSPPDVARSLLDDGVPPPSQCVRGSGVIDLAHHQGTHIQGRRGPLGLQMPTEA